MRINCKSKSEGLEFIFPIGLWRERETERGVNKSVGLKNNKKNIKNNILKKIEINK
jgi:hypothetical protein